MRLPLLVVLPAVASLALARPAAAQPAGPDLTLDAATRAKVIDASLAALTRYYVFPEVAGKMAAEIRRHVAAKKYDALTSARAFAEALTTDLRAVSRDKHLRVIFSPEPIPDRKPDAPPPPFDDVERFREQMRFWNAGYVKAERLDGNIGYLRLDGFVPVAEAAPRAAAAMTLLADTGALIIDLRWNGGGDPASVALLVSYLFAAEDQRHINDIYWRPDNSTKQYWTYPDLSGKRYPDKPVYVLTSKDTFSGAEEFAYDVQNLKRATLVGEVTGGGANPGGPEKVHPHFMVNVPRGRAISPVTKTNWEGTGVRPEVAVPAERALDTAYLAALEKVRPTIDDKRRPGMAKEIDDAIAKLRPAKK
ncbi:MAG TPA: S41 family peptidase [Kofleriaceae bacterium]|nr:S41 family peptidase [Kofleriaceae bacterium]